MISKGSSAEIFLVEEGDRLIFYQLSLEGEIEKVITTKELFFKPSYLGVKKRDNIYLFYMVSAAPPKEREWSLFVLDEDYQEMISFKGEAHLFKLFDIDALLLDGAIYLLTVEGRDQRLIMKKSPSKERSSKRSRLSASSCTLEFHEVLLERAIRSILRGGVVSVTTSSYDMLLLKAERL